MAKRTTIRLVDDLDGGGADCTVTFALDGTEYTIDLSDGNADKMRAALYPFMAGGRRDRSATPSDRTVKPSTTRTLADREALAAIREWGAKHGYKVAAMGRIPRPVTEAYRAAMAEGKRDASRA
jgi:hypothetical protein